MTDTPAAGPTGAADDRHSHPVARLLALSGKAVLVLALAAGVLAWVPGFMADLLIRTGRPMVHLPVQDRIGQVAAAMAPRLFRPSPEAYSVAEVERLAAMVPNAGVALFDASGAMVWRSAGFPEAATAFADPGPALAEGRTLIALMTATDDPGRRYFLALTPVRQFDRVAGGLLMRIDDTALWTTMRDISLTLIAALLAGALLIGGALLQTAARAQRARAQARTEVLHARNAAMSEQLRLGQQMNLLADLNEWLQSSRDLDELYGMVVRFFDVLLPGSRGSIYIYSNSRDVLDGAIGWGGAGHHAHIHPGDCWALRRGRTYEYGLSAVAFACAHVHDHAHAHDDEPEPYLCLPFLAHGETVGLLHVVYPRGLDEAGRRAFRRLAQTCAEQVSLAIANVRLRDELRSQAVRDPLTGLYNRRYMLDRLRALTGRRGGSGLALISVDIDHFKAFNDNHGHDAGDAVIRAVGEAMVAVLDGAAFACRCGGEELAIVLPETGMDGAMEMAERLRARVEATFVAHNGVTLPAVTISVGVAAFPAHARSLPELIQRADAALYTAKRRGRNRVVPADQAEAGILSGPGAADPLAQVETAPDRAETADRDPDTPHPPAQGPVAGAQPAPPAQPRPQSLPFAAE